MKAEMQRCALYCYVHGESKKKQDTRCFIKTLVSVSGCQRKKKFFHRKIPQEVFYVLSRLSFHLECVAALLCKS